MHAFSIFVFAPVQRNLACFTWESTLEIRSLLLLSDGNVLVIPTVSADAIGVVCHQLGLLCFDLHAVCRGGIFKAIYQLDQLLLLSCQCRRQKVNL